MNDSPDDSPDEAFSAVVIEAERALLGSALRAGAGVARLVDEAALRADDFSIPLYKASWSAVQLLSMRNLPVTSEAIVGALTTGGPLSVEEQACMVEHLAAMADAVGFVTRFAAEASAAGYATRSARIVVEAALTRVIRQAVGRAIALVDSDRTAPEMAAAAGDLVLDAAARIQPLRATLAKLPQAEPTSVRTTTT